jgi:hypothetical protein
VFGLLKRHLCLEVSAIAMIDLDDLIRDSPIWFHQGSHGVIAVVLCPLHSNNSFRPRSTVSRAGGCHVRPSLIIFFSPGPVGSE